MVASFILMGKLVEGASGGGNKINSVFKVVLGHLIKLISLASHKSYSWIPKMSWLNIHLEKLKTIKLLDV